MSEMMQETGFDTSSWTAYQQDDALGLSLRKQAADAFNEMEFPTSRTEAWKYTRLAKIRNTVFGIKPDFNADLSAQLRGIDELNGSKLVFVNGFYQAQLSTLESENGLSIENLRSTNQSHWSASHIGKQCDLKDPIFQHLNTAYATDGVLIRIAAKSEIKQNIQCIFVTSGKQVFAGTRNLILCEENAQAHVVMHYLSGQAENSFTNAFTEIIVERNARLTIDKIQDEDESQLNISREEVRQAENSRFQINTMTLNGLLVRNDLRIAVAGQHCETGLAGAYVTKDKQHVDNHTCVDHLVANCTSDELYKGVMDEQSTGVFNGKVFVRKDAQKIMAYQSNGNVLLSDSASINSKPELEIYADDVRCSHGSTTGQLDEEAVFYLRARGLSEKSARALMVGAFIADVLNRIENEAVRQHVLNRLHERFGWQIG